jgi:hypothetical protein
MGERQPHDHGATAQTAPETRSWMHVLTDRRSFVLSFDQQPGMMNVIGRPGTFQLIF